MNSATSNSTSVKPPCRDFPMPQPPPDELLPGATSTDPPAPELLLVRVLLPGLVPGLATAPELEAAPLLLLTPPLKLVPVQSGASPLAAATASPRKPMTVASQFCPPPLAANIEMLEATEPSELPELEAWPSAPAPLELPKVPRLPKVPELPKPPVPPRLPEPLRLVEPPTLLAPLELLELLGLPEPVLVPVRRTRTVICSRPGMAGTGTMSCCQCQSPLPNALMSPWVVPAVGICRLSLASATRLSAIHCASVLSCNAAMLPAAELSDARTAPIPKATITSATITSISVNPRAIAPPPPHRLPPRTAFIAWAPGFR